MTGTAMYTIRRIQREQDLRRTAAFTAEVWATRGPKASMHIGDLLWRYCRHPQPLARSLFPMWFEASGQLAAYMQYEPAGSADIVVHPDTESAALYGSILDLAEQMRRRTLAEHGVDGELNVGCFEDDVRRRDFLTARGYVDTGRGSVHL